MSEPRRITWEMDQNFADALALVLYRDVMVQSMVVPGCSGAERSHCFLNDLRAQIVLQGGDDPFPAMPFVPCFPATQVPTWPDPRILRAEERPAA